MKKTKTMRKTLRFDTAIYPVEALMSSSFKYLDYVYAHFEMVDGSNMITVRLEAKERISERDWKALLDEFSEETLAQALRMKILKATKKTRDHILKIALYCVPADEQVTRRSAALEDKCSEEKMDEELEEILARLKAESPNEDDYHDDPSGILVPWEEKYGEEAAGKPRKEKNETGVRQKNIRKSSSGRRS